MLPLEDTGDLAPALTFSRRIRSGRGLPVGDGHFALVSLCVVATSSPARNKRLEDEINSLR